MFRVIFPNRWFIWAIVLCVVTGVLLWWQITLYSLDQELVNAWKPEQHRKVILSEVDTTGWKTYRNEKYGFEFRYPDAWTQDPMGYMNNELAGPEFKIEIPELVYLKKEGPLQYCYRNYSNDGTFFYDCDFPASISISMRDKSYFIRDLRSYPYVISFSEFVNRVANDFLHYSKPVLTFSKIADRNMVTITDDEPRYYRHLINVNGNLIPKDEELPRPYSDELGGEILIEISSDRILNIHSRHQVQNKDYTHTVLNGILSTLKFFEPKVQ